jgi:hypothetical protein
MLVSRSQTNKIRSLFLFVLIDDLLICSLISRAVVKPQTAELIYECGFFKEMPVSSSSSLEFFDSCFMTELKSRHPNVLQIVGISDEGSKSHFIQFHGSK